MVVIFCRVSPSVCIISQILPEETFAFLLTTEATIQSNELRFPLQSLSTELDNQSSSDGTHELNPAIQSIELRFPLQSLSTELDNQSSSDGERKLRTSCERADGFSATCHSAAVTAGSAVHCITLSLRFCLIQFSSFFTL